MRRICVQHATETNPKAPSIGFDADATARLQIIRLIVNKAAAARFFVFSAL
jgi:hypothetical protein